MPARILIVDDDPQIRESLQRGLTLEGFRTRLAADADQALRLMRDELPDLAVLDVVLPGIDGLAVCRRVRAVAPTLPIIMLTARDAVPDRVSGLEAGADDYLVKPFAFEELLARIRVCLRRREATDPHELRVADLRLDVGTRDVWRGDRAIELTTTEYELLRLFMQHPRQVLTRDVIYERVWGYNFRGQSKVIEVYVRYLREKLEAGTEPRLIHTVRGAGYVLKEG